MEQSKHDLGLILVILEKLSSQTLPKLIFLKKKVDANQELNDEDLFYLKSSISEVVQFLKLTELKPEYLRLATSIITLYGEITATDLALER